MNIQQTFAICSAQPIVLLYSILWLTFKGSIISEVVNDVLSKDKCPSCVVAESVSDFFLQKVVMSET